MVHEARGWGGGQERTKAELASETWPILGHREWRGTIGVTAVRGGGIEGTQWLIERLGRIVLG